MEHELDRNETAVSQEELDELIKAGVVPGRLPEPSEPKLSKGEDTSAANLADKYKKLTKSEETQYSFLKNFPTVFVRIAQTAFPYAKTQTDAVVAYMFCTCPDVAMSNAATFSLTDAQKDLIYGYEKSAFTDFSSRLQSLSKKIDNTQNALFFIRTLIAYTLYDRLDVANPGHRYLLETAKDFDITDSGRFLDFLDDFERANKKLKQQVDNSKGSTTLW